MPGRPDGTVQEWEISSGAAANLEHAITVPQVETIDGIPSQPGGKKKQPFKERNQTRDAIISLNNDVSIAVHPLIGHAAPRPLLRDSIQIAPFFVTLC